MKLFKDISAIVIAFIIASLQLLPVMCERHKSFATLPWVMWLIDKSIWIIGFCCLIIILVTILGFFIKSESENKKWLESILKMITDNYLYGENCHTRVTIFRPDKKKKHLKRYVRFSYPRDLNNSSKIPISKVEGKYNGIIGKCFQEACLVKCNTDDISDIHLAQTFDKNVPKNRERIKKYMADTCISDYSVLHKFRRLSTNFFAYPILDKDVNVWGIIVVDNNEDTVFNFSQLESVIQAFSSIISTTIIK